MRRCRQTEPGPGERVGLVRVDGSLDSALPRVLGEVSKGIWSFYCPAASIEPGARPFCLWFEVDLTWNHWDYSTARYSRSNLLFCTTPHLGGINRFLRFCGRTQALQLFHLVSSKHWTPNLQAPPSSVSVVEREVPGGSSMVHRPYRT